MKINLGPVLRANIDLWTRPYGVLTPPGGWVRVFGYGVSVDLGRPRWRSRKTRKVGPLHFRVLRPGNRFVRRPGASCARRGGVASL